MAPYRELVEKLKKEKSEKFDFDEFLGYEVAAHTEFVAALAYFEEYELLKFCLEQDFARINATVRPSFSDWEPTPLYFITGTNARKNMKDPCKMLRFLHECGASANVAAGDGSTPLWNQTTLDGSLDILQTLLEIGANPNLTSRDGEYEWMPLANSLLPFPDKTDEDKQLPFDANAIKKAKLLLEYGADPNLESPSLSGFPPLILAIRFGFPQPKGQTEILELIEMLLQRGADPNYTDMEGSTPLMLAVENDLHEVGKLLLLYGAKMPAKDDIKIEKVRQMAILDKLAAREVGALLAPAATADELFSCDCDLRENNFPALPDDYANFLKICGGYAFDGVELYGAKEVTDDDCRFTLIDVVSATESFNDYYIDEGYLELDDYVLCIGRKNGDYIVYDPVERKYQVRDHENISDIWDEYDSFEEFFACLRVI